MVSKDTDHLQVPSGTPEWIDRELIALTLDTFEAYYGRMSEEKAVQIILSFSGLAEGWRWS